VRYFAKLRGQKKAVPVEIEPLEGNRYAVTLEGKRHEVDALGLDHGAVSLIIDDASYSVEFDEWGDDVAVHVGDHVSVIDVADERRLKLRAGVAQFSAEGKQTITAPMPGKVVKVLVKVGEEVKEGQGLIVVEAMKMENELKSPKAGKVMEIFATEGGTVEINAKLVSVE
jgi:biotin carboxyl carrier protein